MDVDEAPQDRDPLSCVFWLSHRPSKYNPKAAAGTYQAPIAWASEGEKRERRKEINQALEEINSAFHQTQRQVEAIVAGNWSPEQRENTPLSHRKRLPHVGETVTQCEGCIVWDVVGMRPKPGCSPLSMRHEDFEIIHVCVAGIYPEVFIRLPLLENQRWTDERIREWLQELDSFPGYHAFLDYNSDFAMPPCLYEPADNSLQLPMFAPNRTVQHQFARLQFTTMDARRSWTMVLESNVPCALMDKDRNTERRHRYRVEIMHKLKPDPELDAFGMCDFTPSSWVSLDPRFVSTNAVTDEARRRGHFAASYSTCLGAISSCPDPKLKGHLPVMRMMAFDIETVHSRLNTPGAFPEARYGDPAFSVSAVFVDNTNDRNADLKQLEEEKHQRCHVLYYLNTNYQRYEQLPASVRTMVRKEHWKPPDRSLIGTTQQTEDCTVHYFSSERAMLKGFLDLCDKYSPLGSAVHNISFDVPYLMERMKALDLIPSRSRNLPIDRHHIRHQGRGGTERSYRSNQKGTFNVFDPEWLGMLAMCTLTRSRMELKLKSNKLDAVAEAILKERKVDLPYLAMFRKWWEGNHTDILKYSVWDSVLVAKLLVTMKWVLATNVTAAESGMQFNNFLVVGQQAPAYRRSIRRANRCLPLAHDDLSNQCALEAGWRSVPASKVEYMGHKRDLFFRGQESLNERLRPELEPHLEWAQSLRPREFIKWERKAWWFLRSRAVFLQRQHHLSPEQVVDTLLFTDPRFRPLPDEELVPVAERTKEPPDYPLSLLGAPEEQEEIERCLSVLFLSLVQRYCTYQDPLWELAALFRKAWFSWLPQAYEPYWREAEKRPIGGYVGKADRAFFVGDAMVLLDYASLYPAVLQRWRMCHSSMIADPATWEAAKKRGLVTGVSMYEEGGAPILFCQQAPSLDESDLEHCGFLLPALLRGMYLRRCSLRRAGAEAAARGDEMMAAVYDQKQQLEKVDMNSRYGLQLIAWRIGLMGAPLLGRLITRLGRGRVHLAEQEVQKQPWLGHVEYGDTDSIMPRCTRIQRQDFPDQASYERRVAQWAVKFAHWFKKEFLRTPEDLELEAMMRRYLLLTPKRYLYCKMFPKVAPGQDLDRLAEEDIQVEVVGNHLEIKGLLTQRRDCPEVVKEILLQFYQTIGQEGDGEKALALLKEQVLGLPERPMEDFVMSNELTKRPPQQKPPGEAMNTDLYYAKESSMPQHAVVAQQQYQRNPATAPQVGDRVYYLWIESTDPKKSHRVVDLETAQTTHRFVDYMRYAEPIRTGAHPALDALYRSGHIREHPDSVFRFLESRLFHRCREQKALSAKVPTRLISTFMQPKASFLDSIGGARASSSSSGSRAHKKLFSRNRKRPATKKAGGAPPLKRRNKSKVPENTITQFFCR